MPYTSQNVVVSIFLTLVSYLLPVCCVAGCMKKSHSKKWVFGVVIACILPTSLLWAILHFASGVSHNSSPALIWGCIAFAMLSARNDVIKKREYDATSQLPPPEIVAQKNNTESGIESGPIANDNSEIFMAYWEELKDGVSKLKNHEERKNYVRDFVNNKCQGKSDDFKNELFLFIHAMNKQLQEQNKSEQPKQETQVIAYVDACEPTSKPEFNCALKTGASDDTAAPKQRATFCRYCGTKYGPDDTECPGCGKHVRISFKLKSARIPFFISLTVNVILIVFCVLFVSGAYSQAIAYENEYSSLQAKYDSLNTKYYNISKAAAQRLETITELKPYKEKADFLDAHIALVVSGDGYAYHTYDCHFFQNCDSFWAYNIEAARSKGYSPCKVCH